MLRTLVTYALAVPPGLLLGFIGARLLVGKGEQ